jgi:hypothetical protein
VAKVTSFLKVGWHDAVLFYLIYILEYSFHHIDTIPFAEVPLHLLIASKLSGKNLPEALSRE